jgi:hypothetical protein
MFLMTETATFTAGLAVEANPPSDAAVIRGPAVEVRFT